MSCNETKEVLENRAKLLATFKLDGLDIVERLEDLWRLIPTLAALGWGTGWQAVIAKFYEDVYLLLSRSRSELPLPDSFRVPDLWHPAAALPATERDSLLDTWYFAHVVGKSKQYRQETCHEVGGGVIYRKDSQQ